MTNQLLGQSSSSTLEKDMLSTMFERNKNHAARKKHAQFFTHQVLVEYILDNLDVTEESFVLDPACGVGAFLTQAQNYTSHIYGIDIEPEAVQLCKKNLNCKSPNIIVRNTLKDFDLRRDFPKAYAHGGFDFVIGNPPFQHLKKDVDYNPQIYRDVTCRIVNSATLMIAKSVSLLKKGGFLAFVLPKNILRVDSFYALRQFLLTNTTIVKIVDIGHFFKDVRGDQMVMIIKNERPRKGHLINVGILESGMTFEHLKEYQVPQSKYKEYDIYPLFYDEGLFGIYNRFKQQKANLDDVCHGDIFRGLSVNPQKSLHTSQINSGMLKTYRGASIERFGIKKTFYLSNGVGEQEKVNRLKNEKIILQNLCSKEGGIFATLSSRDELNIDTVTNVLPKDYDIKYILAILNSKIANIYLIYLTFLHSNFTMHTDKTYIGKLPIAMPTKSQEKNVIALVNKLLAIKDKYSKAFFNSYNKLNELLYDIYGFSKDERELINNILKQGMSKKQNG